MFSCADILDEEALGRGCKPRPRPRHVECAGIFDESRPAALCPCQARSDDVCRTPWKPPVPRAARSLRPDRSQPIRARPRATPRWRAACRSDRPLKAAQPRPRPYRRRAHRLRNGRRNRHTRRADLGRMRRIQGGRGGPCEPCEYIGCRLDPSAAGPAKLLIAENVGRRLEPALIVGRWGMRRRSWQFRRWRRPISAAQGLSIGSL